MRRTVTTFAVLTVSLPAWAQTAVNGDIGALAPIAVEAEGRANPVLDAEPSASTVDAAEAVADVPGAALVDNGSLSGQVQYRGLSGYRNDVRIDGMSVVSGGPNWMDPPLHYAPAALLESVHVERGIASVADSVDHIGARVDAETDRGVYGRDDDYELSGRLVSGIRSVDNGHSVAGRAQLANENNKIGLIGSTDRASDTKTPAGTIGASSHARDQYGLDFGHRGAYGETSGFVRHQDTGRSGNPSLPMDIEYMDTTLAELEHQITRGDTEIDAKLSFNDIDHRMTNYELRAAPDFSPLNGDAVDRRYIDATSRGYGGALDLRHPLGTGTLTTGVELRAAEHDATVYNPDNAMFFVDSFDDIRRDTYSLFGQWDGHVAGPWSGELGARYTRVKTDAGDGGVAAGLPAPAQRLAARYAAADKARTDDNVDLVARLSRTLGERWSAHLGLARKTRSPYYIERYGYIPLEATAGLADGNNYVGDIDLEPEVAYETTLGVEFAGERLSFAPQLFYRRINDYITGVAYDDTPGVIDSDVERVSNVNGDATPLRFANVEAELYGADLVASYRINRDWRVDGGATFTRGERTDSDDDLYRIAPADLRATLVYDRDDWRVSLSQRYVAEQTHTSEANEDADTADAETAGYALTDVAADYRVTPAVTVTVGVDNLFDKRYRDFLSGYNRVSNGDIGVGQRLPGAGRNVYARLAATF